MYKKPSSLRKKIGTVFGLLFIGIVLGVVGYNTSPILFGPRITVSSITNGMSLSEPLVQLSGTVSYAREIFINGTPLTFNRQGDFVHDMILSPGYNHIIVSSADRYGKTIEKEFHIALIENPDLIKITRNNEPLKTDSLLSSF